MGCARFFRNVAAPAPSRIGGFTLIEMLLVLVVIGVTLGLVAISLHPNPATQLDREARRLRAVLNEASEEAVSQGVEIALALSNDPNTGQSQYQLLVLDPEKQVWTKPTFDGPQKGIWSNHILNRHVRLELTLEGRQLNARQLDQMARVRGLASPDKLRPSILLLSSGTMTPFTLRLSLRDGDYHVSLVSDGISGVELQ